MIRFDELNGFDDTIIPNNKKMAECRRHYNIYGNDRYIVLDRDTKEIKNGFVMIHYLKSLGIEGVEPSDVCYRENSEYANRKYKAENEPYCNVPTTYVYGYAEGIDQELVWRIPHDWYKLAAELRAGDVVKCNVLDSWKWVTVTRVEKLDHRPIEMLVKIVRENKLYRNGEPINFD